MPKWIDLADKTTGAKLKIARLEDKVYLFVVGMSNRAQPWQAAIDKLRFTSGGSGRFLIRALAAGEKPSAREFRSVWPNAAVVDMPSTDYLLELGKGRKSETGAKDEDREIANETSNARRLGRNADGLEVYESDLGRFIYKDRVGATYESATIRPAMVLRAPDAESLNLCADGYVKGMSLGEVQHSEDFESFLAAIAPDVEHDDSLRSAAHAAIDAAVLRSLAGDFDTAQNAYGESVRLYGLQPPYSGRQRGAATMPTPLSIIAQRLLGDTSGKTVAIPNAWDGASFSFLPKDSRIRAFKGDGDLSTVAAGLTQHVKDRAEVEWLDEFVPAREVGTDALFFNADPVRDRDGSRSDYSSAMMALRALAPQGRAVMVLAGDDPLRPGVLSTESERFMTTLSSRYLVEEAFEVGSELTRGAGCRNTLRLLSVRNAPPESQSETLGAVETAQTSEDPEGGTAKGDRPSISISRFFWKPGLPLKTAHAWDDVKSIVDEAIARARVREASSDAVSVENATRVSSLQSPYIAFSKVGEARTMVPRNLQAPIQAALADIESISGAVDDFVRNELSIGEDVLKQSFGPEQVDALAIMINRIKKGRAPILADETGIGKGRTIAGLCTWASKQGRPVVFVTDRANLFSDMARDMRDIGEWGRFRPLITNSDGNILDMIKPPVPAPAARTEDGGQEQAPQDGAENQNAPALQAAVDAVAPKSNILVAATTPEAMRGIMERNDSIEAAGANIVFTTYSQIAGEDNAKALWIKNQLEDALLVVDEAHIAAGSDSSIARQVSEMTNLAWGVVYSSATWAKSPKNLHIYARALPETVNMASLSETMARGGEAFAEVFSSMLARDGALIRREHDLSRLEFVLEVDHVNAQRNRDVADLVSTVMGQMTLVSGTLEKMMVKMSRASLDALKAARDVLAGAGGGPRGNIFTSSFGAGSMLYQVQRRMNAALNVDNAERLARRAAEEGRKPVIVFDDTSESFVKRAIESAQRERAERLASGLIEGDEGGVVISTPTIRDLLRKVVDDLCSVKVSEVTYEEVMAARAEGRDLVEEEFEQANAEQALAAQAGVDALDADAATEPAAATGPATDDVEVGGNEPAANAGAAAEQEATDEIDVDGLLDAQTAAAPVKIRRKVRRVKFEELPNLTEQQRRIFADGIAEIEQAISAVPAIPLSVPDEIHKRLRAMGMRTGEISGRGFELEDVGNGRSRVVRRAKSKALVNRTVEGFNSFVLDAVIINRSAATGLSLHASPRFRDHRRRELIECQSSENPTDRVQLFGRVNRYDQVSTPRISIAATGVPGETRHQMMQNKKLTSMNANVRSSPESHALVGSVVDLLNPIGREVCKNFLLDNPLYATRMAIKLSMIETPGFDAASAFTRYISLLPVQQQDNLYEQVNQLFEEAVIKAEMAGDSPLKTKEFNWKAQTVAQDVVFGLDHGGLGSAFDGPVYSRALQYEVDLKPMGWQAVREAVAESRRRMIASGHAEQIGTMLDDKTPIVKMGAIGAATVAQISALARVALAATGFASVEEAMRHKDPNPVKRGMVRKLWLEENLEKMVPGARISLPHPIEYYAKTGATLPHIITDVVPPKEGKESQLGQWKFSILKPGQERPAVHSLSSLMTNIKLVSDIMTDEAEAYNQVRIGQDVVLHSESTSNSFFVDSFDNSPSGKRTRTASVLTGNMYLASEFAAQAKVGHGILYTDERGIRQRAILMDSRFGPTVLRNMPVRVWTSSAVERLMLEISGLSEERLVRDEAGEVVSHGEPACEPNTQDGFLMHTSFAGSWRYARLEATAHDALSVVPGLGVVMTVGKEQVKRVRGLLAAAQKRVREAEEKERAEKLEKAEKAQQQSPAGAAAPVAPAAPAAAAAAAPDEAANAAATEETAQPTGRRGPKKVRKTAADDPNHVVISASGPGGRGKSMGVIVLKADTPQKMLRAIHTIATGTGLQLYVSPTTDVGRLAKSIVREDLLMRIRKDIGDDPERLARLEAQIERMDTEAAITRQGFLRLTASAQEVAGGADIVEHDGRLVSVADLEAGRILAEGEQALEGVDAVGTTDADSAADVAAAPEEGALDREIERPRRVA